MKSSKGTNWIWIGIVAMAIMVLALCSFGIAFLVNYGVDFEEGAFGIGFIAGGIISLFIGVLVAYLAAKQNMNELLSEIAQKNTEIKNLTDKVELKENQRAYAADKLAEAYGQLEEKEREFYALSNKLALKERGLLDITKIKDDLFHQLNKLKGNYETLKAVSLEYQALHGKRIRAYETKIEQHVRNTKRARRLLSVTRAEKHALYLENQSLRRESNMAEVA